MNRSEKNDRGGEQLALTRRRFAAAAASIGASLALGASRARKSAVRWTEHRDLFPQGVASGDPHPESVILWTRRPPANGVSPGPLTVEVSEDEGFARIVATSKVQPLAEMDWTVRVLAAGLKPSREYFYRFSDKDGAGSRIGRTLTAPDPTEDRAVRFAFASCQMVPAGSCNAYRRMIFEDEQAPPEKRLDFVMHLGDYVYEIVWYPEDRAHYYSRTLTDVVRYPSGEKIAEFHVPTTVEDYRSLYRGYLTDPDLMDVRARFPFVCMWDNHEFSWKGFQSIEVFDTVRPAATRKVAACQAWFEYQPARVLKAGGDTSLERYIPPPVTNAPIESFDDFGTAQEANNLAAINSLKLFRTFRFGKNVELILTDNRSYRSNPIGDGPLIKPFQSKGFPEAKALEAIEILDAGRAWNNGHPPDTIAFDGQAVPNARKDAPPQSMLGKAQKSWFFEQLAHSDAPWKIWGNSVGMLDWRIDFQNLPTDIGVRWPGAGYALLSGDDWSGYFVERAEIFDFLKAREITGVVSLAGDRHSFFAGAVSKTLPPKAFEPVALDFVGASISAVGFQEAAESIVAKDNPIKATYLYTPADGGPVGNAADFSARYGVRASLALQKTHDLAKALAEKNDEVSPHLSFMDTGGHGYGIVTVDARTIDVEFVCIPRPLTRDPSPDGGPLRYRVTHRAKLWVPGEAPKLERVAIEGEPPLGA